MLEVMIRVWFISSPIGEFEGAIFEEYVVR